MKIKTESSFHGGYFMSKTIQSFLGANTPMGFRSLFSELYNPYRDSRMYIIKGGPGTGKSSFMKKVAKAAESLDLDTERVYCSSDPKSLDAVIIPKLGLCLADGTAPHVLEPLFPGASENIINLGNFWDREKLYEKADPIRSVTIENSIFHRRSTKYLSAAGAISEDTRKIVQSCIDESKAESFAQRFCSREAPRIKGAGVGKINRRFLSGITPDGIVFFDSTVTTLASRVIGLVDEYSAVSGILIERIAQTASKNGYDVIACPCPMKPDEFEHIIIPKLSLALLTVKSSHVISVPFDRLIHARRFFTSDVLRYRKNRLAFGLKTADELTRASIELLAQAKKTHDKLESFYKEAMDFKALDRFTEEFIDREIYARA